MEQRISLITLGVADLAAPARSTRPRLEQGATPDDDVAFFQAGEMVFGLWGRAQLAEDSAVEDAAAGAASRSRTTAVRRRRSMTSSRRRQAGGPSAGPPGRRSRAAIGRLRRPRRPPVGGRAEPHWTIGEDGSTRLERLGSRPTLPETAGIRKGGCCRTVPASDRCEVGSCTGRRGRTSKRVRRPASPIEGARMWTRPAASPNAAPPPPGRAGSRVSPTSPPATAGR